MDRKAWRDAISAFAAASVCFSFRSSSCGWTWAEFLDAAASGLFAGMTGSSALCHSLPEAAERTMVTASAPNRTRCRHVCAFMTIYPEK
jgi:hypothetical protein